MTTSSESHFKQNYQTHLKHLKLKGLQPKTIEAYARAIRRVGAYFDYRVFFFTVYSLGLRLGEGLRLQVGDIDADASAYIFVMPRETRSPGAVAAFLRPSPLSPLSTTRKPAMAGTAAASPARRESEPGAGLAEKTATLQVPVLRR